MPESGPRLRGDVARFDLAAGSRVPVLDAAALDAIERALEGIVARGVKALVLTGGRDGIFAAGADLNELAALDSMTALSFSRRGQRLFDALEAAPAILVAAVGGRCIGGAFDLVMSCDVRVAAGDAMFEHPGPRMGFITGYGGTTRLPMLAGRAAAEVLAGRAALNAEEALALGLVSEIAPEDRLEERAQELARRVAEAPLRRIRLVKEALRVLRGSASRRRIERRLVELELKEG